jgi:hypothetical protein
MATHISEPPGGSLADSLQQIEVPFTPEQDYESYQQALSRNATLIFEADKVSLEVIYLNDIREDAATAKLSTRTIASPGELSNELNVSFLSSRSLEL